MSDKTNQPQEKKSGYIKPAAEDPLRAIQFEAEELLRALDEPHNYESQASAPNDAGKNEAYADNPETREKKYAQHSSQKEPHSNNRGLQALILIWIGVIILIPLFGGVAFKLASEIKNRQEAQLAAELAAQQAAREKEEREQAAREKEAREQAARENEERKQAAKKKAMEDLREKLANDGWHAWSNSGLYYRYCNSGSNHKVKGEGPCPEIEGGTMDYYSTIEFFCASTDCSGQTIVASSIDQESRIPLSEWRIMLEDFSFKQRRVAHYETNISGHSWLTKANNTCLIQAQIGIYEGC